MIYQIFFTVVALVLLFIFSINKFSRQIERVAGDKLKDFLGRLTSNRVLATLTGAGVASVFQSSTITTVMTVGLVNAGIITFTQSLGVIFGANIGTAITSQLIALNVVAIAPFILIFGFLLLKFGGKYSTYGRSFFYFGLVFLCISLITQIVSPLSENPQILGLLSKMDTLWLSILAGIILTLVFQASAITSGIVLVLAASGFVDFSQGVGLMLGANVGTTSTALLAALPMGNEAKKAALAHFLFNVIGLIIFIPLLPIFTSMINAIGGTVIQQVANLHLTFNVLTTIIFLLTINQFSSLITWLAGRRIFHIHLPHWHQ
ncbi:MAG TPA: Na/Pi symporter [Candidatus Paceibacterota bacterium]|nr:Na/Pi symporter [Candidatus Paceibacterota bacterium]